MRTRNCISFLASLLVSAALGAACQPVERPYADPAVLEARRQQEQLEAQPDDGQPIGESGDSASMEPGVGAEGLAAENATETTQTETAQLGAICSANRECESGQCVDGVCCENGCRGVCATCNGEEPGRCVATASDVESCPVAECPASTDCLLYDEGSAQNNCLGIGRCDPDAQCEARAVPAGTACGADGVGQCDGQGACLIADKASLGETCGADDDCAEGACVDGPDGASICCNSACDGECEACGTDGICDEAPAADERCGSVDCPQDSVCRDYDDSLVPGQCASFGQCASATQCGFSDLRPVEQCECDGQGECGLRDGVLCAGDVQCDSGRCEATAGGGPVCCAQSCGAGEFCSSDGSRCVACEGNAVRCSGTVGSGDVAERCVGGSILSESCANGCTNGVGCNARAPIGFSCASSACESPGVCQTDTSGGRTCCNGDCAAIGRVCAPDGSCQCAPGEQAIGGQCRRQLGDPCSSTAECAPGATCTDGVCCSESCGGTCERCQAGTGQCVAESQGTQEAGCTGQQQCSGSRGQCGAQRGATCTGNGDCLSGNCEPTAGGGPSICCESACGGETPFCAAAGALSCVECDSNAQCGNGCSNGRCLPLRSPGEVCAVGEQCSTGSCDTAEGGLSRCCPGCGSGQLCTPEGACIIDGAPEGSLCEDNDDCESRICVSATFDVSICCLTTCPAARPHCAPSGAGCVECNDDSQCPNGCIGNTCAPLRSAGTACTSDAQCSTEHCVETQVVDSAARRCCPECGSDQVCGTNGQCAAPLSGDFEECQNNADCAAGVCQRRFADVDGDGFGVTNTGRRICVPDALAGNQTVTTSTGQRVSLVGSDCCDVDLAAARNVHPGQTQFFATGQEACTSVAPFDYDCSGTIEDQFGDDPINDGCGLNCDGTIWVPSTPECGEAAQALACRVQPSEIATPNPICEVLFNGAPQETIRRCH